MKSIQQSLFKKLNPLVIYQDELLDLIDLLQKNCERVEIVSGNFQYDNLDELLKKFGNRRIPDLKIKGTGPIISIDLSSENATISTLDDDLKLIGLFNECIKILKRRSQLYGLLSSYPCFVAIVLILSSTAVLPKPWQTYGVFSLVLYLFWYVLATCGRHSIIYPIKSDCFDDFWARNKDDLLIKALIGIVTGIIGFILGRLLPK